MERISSARYFIGLEEEGVINFGSGQPDLPPPEEVLNTGAGSFKYSPIEGDKVLRAKLAELHEMEPDNFIITNGASEALNLAINRSIMPGDKVLLTRPYYYSYPDLVMFNHGIPIYTELVDGKIDIEDFGEKLKYAKIAIVNSPGNPTGSVQDKEVLKTIEDMCNSEEKTLIFDEVYDNLIYKGEHYSPRGKFIANINSFSKTYSMCGDRVGYLYSENGIVSRMVDHKTHSSMNAPNTSQAKAIAALDVSDEFRNERLQVWRERRDLIYGLLTDMGLDVWSPDGAFYIFPKVPDPDRTVEDLFFDHKIITYKGKWFGAPDRIRISYPMEKEKIIEGMGRLKGYLDRL